MSWNLNLRNLLDKIRFINVAEISNNEENEQHGTRTLHSIIVIMAQKGQFKWRHIVVAFASHTNSTSYFPLPPTDDCVCVCVCVTVHSHYALHVYFSISCCFYCFPSSNDI